MNEQESFIDNLHFIALGGYTKPPVVEDQQKKWVTYGEDNNYFQYLIDRYNGSPTHNAIVNGIAQMIYGEGIQATDSKLKPASWIEFQRMIKPEELRKISIDVKLLGMIAIQCLYNESKTKIVECYHHPAQTIRAEIADVEGNIRAWFSTWDWTKAQDRRFRPKRIPAFGWGKPDEFVELLVVRPYSAGNFYYPPVDYQGGVQYAEVEEEIANFNINYLQNGLFAGALINFNGAIPPEEERRKIEKKIAEKFSGSTNAGRFIVSFNGDPSKKADVTPFDTKEYSALLEYVSREAMQKLMIAHRLTSPMLLGIKDNTGLGNNADELRTASILFDNTVVRPFQNLIIEGLDKITRFNGYILDLYFKTLQPLEFIDISSTSDQATREKETGVKSNDSIPKIEDANAELIQKEASYNGAQISSALQIMQGVKDGVLTQDQAIAFLVQMLQFDPSLAQSLFEPNALLKSHKHDLSSIPNFNEDEEQEWIEYLTARGETIDPNEWELISETPVEDPDAELNFYDFETIDPTTHANPQDKSQDGDSGLVKIRYKYAPNRLVHNSRKFCVSMVNASIEGVVFRREDIVRMGDQGVNGEFAPKGESTYSIWKFKGGANCHHYWTRVVYFRKRNKNGQFEPASKTPEMENDNKINVESIRKDVDPKVMSPDGWDKAKTRPIDMPNHGYLNPR